MNNANEAPTFKFEDPSLIKMIKQQSLLYPTHINNILNSISLVKNKNSLPQLLSGFSFLINKDETLNNMIAKTEYVFHYYSCLSVSSLYISFYCL